MLKKKYLEIIAHYEECLTLYGDTHLGVDWPKLEHIDIRNQVMLDVIKDKSSKVSLIDFGCGTSNLYEYIQKKQLKNIEYSGLDISDKFISLCRKKISLDSVLLYGCFNGRGKAAKF